VINTFARIHVLGIMDATGRHAFVAEP
jgi:hypothetical protein